MIYIISVLIIRRPCPAARWASWSGSRLWVGFDWSCWAKCVSRTKYKEKNVYRLSQKKQVVHHTIPLHVIRSLGNRMLTF
jgi:hypothetical protein